LFHAQFHEDSTIEFPRSGELIAGGENRRAVYRTFPGRPSVTRILTDGDLAVMQAKVDYGEAASVLPITLVRAAWSPGPADRYSRTCEAVC
jgi:hypothetical protein